MEVTLTEWNRSKVQFNQDSPVVVTLFFKKKLDGSEKNSLNWMSQWSMTCQYKRAQLFISYHNEQG